MYDEIVPLNPCDYSVVNGRVILEAPPATGFLRKPDLIQDDAAFCCVQRSGDFTFSARVATGGKSLHDGAFLMVRESAKCWIKLGVLREANGTFRIVSRRTDVWSQDKFSPERTTGSCCLKVVRSGHTFTLSYSDNCTAWKTLDSFEVKMKARVAVGFGAQSPEGKGCEATVSDITLADVAMVSFLEQD